MAESHNISLTSYEPIGMIHKISLSYIVHIHLCFETFVKDVCRHARLFGNVEVKEKVKEESWLLYAERLLLNQLPKEIQPLFDLCEYYRLIRNTAVHDLCDVETRTKEYRQLKKYDFPQDTKFEKLKAPNEYENISFDDFVMFARSCNELANFIYANLRYDYKKLVNSIEHEQIKKLTKYKNNRVRGEKALSRYIVTNFKNDPVLDTIIGTLFDTVMARSSNR